MQAIERDGATISYHVYGSGETTLLFIHGSYIDQTWWKSQAEYFRKDYKVVTFDLPGHGESGRNRKDWSMAGFAEDVAVLIRRLDLKNVIVVAHSMGADVALMAVTSHPENIIGLVIVDMMKNAATPLPAKYQDQVAGIIEDLKKDFSNTNEQYARMALLTKQTPSSITDLVVSAYRNAYEPMARAITPEIFGMYKVEQELLPRLRLKLRLVTVDYMPTNEEPLKKYAGAGYELTHMKGTSHYPMIENPDELNEKLEEVIRKIRV